MTPHLSVVAPFYNEGLGIKHFYETTVEVLDGLDVTFDLVFVDDGSSDDTLEQLNAIATQDDRVSVLALSRNFGHQIALTAGLDYACGDYVITMDSDLQHPPTLIPLMLKKHQEGFAIVTAVREDETEDVGFAKNIFSRVFYRVFEMTTQVPLTANAADFRLLSREVVEALRDMPERHRFLRGMVAWVGFDSTTISYKQPPRFAGTSKYTFRKSLRLAHAGFFSFSTVPLRIVFWMGLSITALGFLYLLYVLGRLVLLNDLVPGWASVIVVMLIMSGVQLISIGVISQYIGMIVEESKSRPLYLLKHAVISEVVKSERKHTLNGTR